MALPTRGQADWDDEMNNHISGLEAQVAAADARSVVAASDAVYARNRAEEVAAAASTSALIVVASGAIDLPDAKADGYLIGYKVTGACLIEGVSFGVGSYVFERDSTVYGGWTYRVLVTGSGVVALPDSTPPVVGTLTSSAITTTGFTLTVTGASDAVALHATPYSFSTDNGSTWSTYQSSAVLVVTGRANSTAYTCKHRVKDAAGNVTVGTAITVTTTTPAAMPISDAMAGSNGTLLIAHSPDTGGVGNWTKPSGNGVLTLDGAGKAVLSSADSTFTKWQQDITDVADATASVEVTYLTTGDIEIGPAIRMNGSNYLIFCKTAVQLVLVQSNPSVSLIGSPVNFTPTAGAVYKLIISATGSTVTGKVQRVSDGLWFVGGSWQSTEAAVITATTTGTGAGKVGIMAAVAAANGSSVDNFTASAP